MRSMSYVLYFSTSQGTRIIFDVNDQLNCGATNAPHSDCTKPSVRYPIDLVKCSKRTHCAHTSLKQSRPAVQLDHIACGFFVEMILNDMQYEIYHRHTYPRKLIIAVN